MQWWVTLHLSNLFQIYLQKVSYRSSDLRSKYIIPQIFVSRVQWYRLDLSNMSWIRSITYIPYNFTPTCQNVTKIVSIDRRYIDLQIHRFSDLGSISIQIYSVFTLLFHLKVSTCHKSVTPRFGSKNVMFHQYFILYGNDS